VFKYPVDVVLEATGLPAVLDELRRAKPGNVDIIGAGSLRFLWALVQNHVRAARQLTTQLETQITIENTQLYQRADNARLLEETQRRHRAAVGLAETGRLITQSLDSEDMARRITDSLRALLGGQYAALFQVKADSEDLVAVAVSGDDGPTFGPHMVLPRGTGIAALAVRERQPVATRDVLTDARIVLAPEVRDRIACGPCRAGLAVPLIVQGRVIGALAMRDLTGRQFSLDEIELARALADQAAVSLENARLFGEATRRKRGAQELARLAQVVTGSLDLREVLERVVRAATDLLPDAAAHIWVIEGNHLVLRSETGANSPPRSGGKIELALGEGLIGHVAATREQLVVEDVLADPRTVNVTWMRQEGYVSALYIPLLVRERLVGVSSLLIRHRHHFDPEELDSLTSFANQAAIAIENAMLLQESRTHQGRLETLLQTSRELSRIQPLESLLGRIAKACGDLLGCDSVGIRILEGDDLVMTASYGDAHKAMSAARLKVGESLSGTVAATGESLVVSDPVNDPRVLPAHREAYRRGGWGGWLGVPIKLGEQLIGVVSCRARQKGTFSRRIWQSPRPSPPRWRWPGEQPSLSANATRLR
jgi:GAF domain-containing protein